MTELDRTDEGVDQGRDDPVPGRRVRRWLALIGGALGVAVVIALVVATLTERDDAPIDTAIAETASRASPEVAALIYAANRVAVEVQQRFPQSADAADVMAQLHFRFGKANQAVEWWTKCLELDPRFESAYLFIATTALEKGDHAQAEVYFRKAAELDPDSSVLPVQLGEVLMHQGKLEQAIAVLEENRDAHPRAMPNLALLGQAYLQVKKYEKAREALEKTIELGPGYTNAYYGLYRCCVQLGDKEACARYMQKFKELKAKDEQSHRTGLRTSDDVATTRAAVAHIHAAAGQACIAHGDVATGERILRESIRLHPAGLESRQLLAWLFTRQGRKAEAIEILSEADPDASDNAGELFGIAALFVELECFDEAEKAYKRVIDVSPQQAIAYATLADFYLMADRNLADARSLAQKAVSIDPTARHHALLAMVCLRMGDLPAAAAAAEHSLRLEPENENYRRLLASTRLKD